MTRFHFLFALGFVAFLAACSATHPTFKGEIAQRLAAPAFMIPREIDATPFTLLAYERMHQRFASANIYIEGDGHPFTSNLRLDPTPTNPVALHLATRDKADNVVWIARPCQYRWKKPDDSWCDAEDWREKRFGPDVIRAYNIALHDIKKRYNIDKFNLIGFGGGATVASILAAKRLDVETVRTVAGNLHPEVHATHHNRTAPTESLDLFSFAGELSRIPQYHFIGGQDEEMPPKVFQSFSQSMPNTNCIQHELIQEAEHMDGWVDKWPELLKRKPLCKADPMAQKPLYDPVEPIRIQREAGKGAKNK